MPLIRKRRAPAEPSPSPPPARRRKSPSVSEASSFDGNVEDDRAYEDSLGSWSSHEQMVKKLVRMALACEYSRQPIRRAEIAAKVMAPNTGRQFKHIFAAAQRQLQTVFGMEMTELPQREKVTISQKRAAQRTQSASNSASKSYVLTSTLPARYRVPEILIPSRIPSAATEASYTGLYTFIISIIYLSPQGTIAESRLDRHLKRMNADDYVLHGEKTEKVLKRMEREGYIVRVRERDGGGEETIDYIVGPRGKAEVGERAVAGVVRRVYGKKDIEADELEKKLVRSLGEVAIEKKTRVVVQEEGGEGEEGGVAANEDQGGRGRGKRSSARSHRGRRDADDEDEEEEEEEDEDEDEQGSDDE